jgi:protein gp37
VFVCPWSDFWHEDADLWRAEAWEIIKARPDVTFLLVTKRPERIIDQTYRDHPRLGLIPGEALANVWHIVTIENQAAAVARLRYLRDLRHWGPWPVLGISAEPLLSPLMLDLKNRIGVDWVVAGCESGPNRRHAPLRWFAHLRDQCVASRIPYFLKQIEFDGNLVKTPFLDGRVWTQMPGGAK